MLDSMCPYPVMVERGFYTGQGPLALPCPKTAGNEPHVILASAAHSPLPGVPPASAGEVTLKAPRRG